MFTDVITTGTVPVAYKRRGSSNTNRISRVPVGDPPSLERRMDVAHETTAAKRVNTLCGFGLTRIDGVTGKVETLANNLKISRTSGITLVETRVMIDHLVKFLAVEANVDELFNQGA